MKSSFVALCAVLLGLFISLSEAQERAYEPPAPVREVAVVRYGWYDAARGREVPAKIYFPKGGAGPFPIIIFSHGLGGSRENYEYLGRHWAGCGYVSVHLQHLGSDDGVWKNKAPAEVPQAMLASTLDLRNAANRPKDVSFAIGQLLALNGDTASPFKGRLDGKRIGVAGHSFGGFTSMAIAGQDFGPGQWGDPRVKAAIQMSAPVARPDARNRAYAGITMPVFHMTGTKDDSPIGETKADERRIAFDKMTAAETCLVTFRDGDHMIFSGRLLQDTPHKRQDAIFQELICAGSSSFWDAWLSDDAAAHRWLMGGGFARRLGGQGTFEAKKPAK